MQARVLPLIYFLFTLSGFAGLIYESLWSRYLKLILGHSSYGQILTLILYMGGLGIGSFLGGRLARRFKHPLLLYAIAEGLIGLGGLLYHGMFIQLQQLMYQILPQLPAWSTTSVKTLLASLITVPWAICLGVTFPALATGLMKLSQDAGKKSLPGLYFTNSLGGAAGILAASYFLIPAYGTPGSLIIAAFINLALAGGFYLLAKLPALEQNAPELPEQAHELEEELRSDWLVPILLSTALLTGLSSFLYEISWIRLLCLVIGSSTHAFDLMVSAFILGLAGGGLFARSLHQHLKRPIRALALIQIAMGLMAGLSLLSYQWLMQMINTSHTIFQANDAAYPVMAFYKYALCIVLMLPASFFAGTTLPLITWTLVQSRRNSQFIGSVYGWNTIGSIIGSALGGLVLMPLLQLKWTLLSGALIDLLLGWGLLLLVHQGQLKTVLTGAAACLLLLPAFRFQFDAGLLTSGAYRGRVKDSEFKEEKTTIIHGRTATISFHQAPDRNIIKTNGKPDASVMNQTAEAANIDSITQIALAMFPINTRTEPYRAAMIGMGSGMSAHTLLADPLLEELDMIEIEPAVYELAKGFMPNNRRVYESKKIKVIFDDAKSYFHRQQQPYDVIISEPSNPWVSGVSSLFTEEFYADIKRFLTHQGVLVQWMHSYEFNDDLMLSILSALDRQFKHVAIFGGPQDTSGSLSTVDIFILASQEPVKFNNPLRQIAELQPDLQKIQADQGWFTLQSYLTSNFVLKPLLVNYNPNSDFYPLVDNGAEEAFFTKSSARMFSYLKQSAGFYQTLLEPNYQILIDQRLGRTQAERSNLLRTLEGLLQLPNTGYKSESLKNIFNSLVKNHFARLSFNEPALQGYKAYLRSQSNQQQSLQFELLEALAQESESVPKLIAANLKQVSPAAMNLEEARLAAIYCLQHKENELYAQIYEKWALMLMSKSEQLLLNGLYQTLK